jgi:hypothetical protein
VPYFDFAPDMRTGGHVINPVWGPDGAPPADRVHYRNNRDFSGPPLPDQSPVMHRNGVDLWAADGAGHPWGVNSWK